MNLFNISFAFLAGILTTLSPCVLPVLPFVTASSQSKNKFGPVALSMGLLITFVGSTLIISASGFLFGLDPDLVRKIGGLLLALSGALFLIPKLQDAMTEWLGKLTRGANGKSGVEITGAPLLSEFLSGLFLGVVWTPCSGPSLGVALGLAAESGSAAKAALTLLAFGVGAVVPLLIFAYSARRLTSKFKNHFQKVILFKKILGVLMVLFGILIFTNFDKNIEALLTNLLPDFWIRFTTKF
jgi:cytochrome c-type biogenesis protein